VSPPRRIGTTTSETRARLLDATEQLMLEEGYAAVSSRRVAARAGVKAPLVHYYFPTLDDLFIAVFRRRSERNLQQLAENLEADRPLHAIWEYASDRTGTALTTEFLALANHRKAIKAEIAEVADRFRKLQLEVLTSAWQRYGIDPDLFPPAAIVVLMAAIPRVIVSEEALGLTSGHPEARGLVERYLDQFEGRPPRTPRKASRTRKGK
jgi:AcrR family transcriptional regulator